MSEEKKVQEDFLTGFAVLIGKDGNIFLETSKEALAVKAERDATLREVRRYMAEILSDIEAQSAAEYTLIKLAALNKQDK